MSSSTGTWPGLSVRLPQQHTIYTPPLVPASTTYFFSWCYWKCNYIRPKWLSSCNFWFRNWCRRSTPKSFITQSTPETLRYTSPGQQADAEDGQVGLIEPAGLAPQRLKSCDIFHIHKNLNKSLLNININSNTFSFHCFFNLSMFNSVLNFNSFVIISLYYMCMDGSPNKTLI